MGEIPFTNKGGGWKWHVTFSKLAVRDPRKMSKSKVLVNFLISLRACSRLQSLTTSFQALYRFEKGPGFFKNLSQLLSSLLYYSIRHFIYTERKGWLWPNIGFETFNTRSLTNYNSFYCLELVSITRNTFLSHGSSVLIRMWAPLQHFGIKGVIFRLSLTFISHYYLSDVVSVPKTSM